MKKTISIITTSLLIMTLSACGGQSASTGGSTSAASSGAGSEAAAQDLVMGTGSSGGTYFALGGAMANAINNKLADQGITITAQSTGASVENINLLNSKELDLAIAMNSVAAEAVDGKGAFPNPAPDFKAIGVVYNEVYQIVANADTGAKEVEDLRGMKVAIGPAGSGTAGLSELVLRAAGIDPKKDIQAQSDSFGDAATKMKDGHIQAACNVLAIPASSIIEMTTAMKLSYIDISDEILAEIQKEAPYYTRKVIPAGTYSDQTEDCNTVTCKAVLYCRSDLDDETVYQITKAFYESGDEIAAAHATGKEVQLEGCLDGVTTPIHLGAAKYFKEKGMDVPDNG